MDPTIAGAWLAHPKRLRVGRPAGCVAAGGQRDDGPACKIQPLVSPKNKWVTPSYSRGAVERAGEFLRASGRADALSLESVNDVINNWRSSHSFPLNTLQMGLREKAKFIDGSAIVAQRLKRVHSIIQKLQRFPKMKLSRMQDIGGARAVVQTIGHVDALHQLYGTTRARHGLANEKDYIRHPKRTGYRGVHLVYRYHSDRNDAYNDLQIELQLRTRTQHAWATAVETVGTFLGESLKSSQGPGQWLRFFELIGSGFATREGGPLGENVPDDPNELIEEIRAAAQDLEVKDTLTTFRTALRIVRQVKGHNFKYFLLVLQPKERGPTLAAGTGKGEREMRIMAFHELRRATDRYLHEEQRLANTSGDVVLVSSDSLASLERAFPNYFADSSRFLTQMDRLLKRAVFV